MKQHVFRFIMIVVVMGLLGSLDLSAQIKGNNIVVTVTPDHQDWNYRVGEKANFSVNVRKSGTLLDNVKIDYEAGPVMFPDVKKSTILKDGTMKWSGALKLPGFYRFKVIAHVDGRNYEGLCTAGFSPEKILPFAQEPKDFDAFWKRRLMRLARTTSIQRWFSCQSDAPRTREFLKSVITTIAGALRCTAS